MPWPPKCSPKVVQCSVCGAENAHPGSNGVHLCNDCAPNHGYFCKHCGKYHLTPGGLGPAYLCPNCKGLLCAKCYGLVAPAEPDAVAYAKQPADKEELTLDGMAHHLLEVEGLTPSVASGKIEAIKLIMNKTGVNLLVAKQYVEGTLKPSATIHHPATKHLYGSFPPTTWGKPGVGETKVDYGGLEKKVAGKLAKDKKLPKGFVTHGTATKPQHLFHPSASQQQVFSEWELEPMLDLTRAAADYYLLVLMDSLQDSDIPNVKPMLQHQVALMDIQFQRYLHMAVGGELRHARRYYSGAWTAFAPEIVGLFKNTQMKGGRHDAWIVWKGFVEKHGWEQTAGWAAHVFNSKGWSSSFGGKNWGNVAVTLHQRLKGELSPLVFVDTTLGLQHNTGCVFNKKVGWSYTGLQKVLDAGRQVDFDKAHPMQVLVDYASDVVTNLLEGVLEKYVKGEVG